MFGNGDLRVSSVFFGGHLLSFKNLILKELVLGYSKERSAMIYEEDNSKSVSSLFELAAMAIPRRMIKHIPEHLLDICIEVWKFRRPCGFISIQWLYGNGWDVIPAVPFKSKVRVSCCTLDAFAWKVSPGDGRFVNCLLYYGRSSSSYCSSHSPTHYSGCCVWESSAVTYFSGDSEGDWMVNPLPQSIGRLRGLL
jgi:hypothetical protein